MHWGKEMAWKDEKRLCDLGRIVAWHFIKIGFKFYGLATFGEQAT